MNVYLQLYAFDDIFRSEKKVTYIVGTDEAGRGPLAGPVVAAAVILNPDKPIPAINDSKQIAPKQRTKLFDEIIEGALDYAIEECSPQCIDQINILNATKQATKNAILKITHPFELILTDALGISDCPAPIQSFVKGDTKSASIAAASILAKVHRDRIMQDFDARYPEYGFGQHKGYPTKQHILALQKYGPCPIHRFSYKPVQEIHLVFPKT